MSSQLANRLWAAIGNKPKQEGINVVQVHQATWRTQPIGHIKPAYGYAYTALFAVALAAFLAYPGIWEEVAKWNDWVESLKVLGGNISFLDFCGSAMTCFAFRRSQEQAIARNDKKVLQLHASPLAHYATTIITCTFLQFGGTTTTAVLLGQNASWAAGTHVWSALLLAWWLTFSFPGDLWYKAMHTPFLFLPLKIGQTIRSAPPSLRLCGGEGRGERRGAQFGARGVVVGRGEGSHCRARADAGVGVGGPRLRLLLRLLRVGDGGVLPGRRRRPPRLLPLLGHAAGVLRGAALLRPHRPPQRAPRPSPRARHLPHAPQPPPRGRGGGGGGVEQERRQGRCPLLLPRAAVRAGLRGRGPPGARQRGHGQGRPPPPPHQHAHNLPAPRPDSRRPRRRCGPSGRQGGGGGRGGEREGEGGGRSKEV